MTRTRPTRREKSRLKLVTNAKAEAEEVPVTLPDPELAFPAIFLGQTVRENYNICQKCKALCSRKFAIYTYQKCMAFSFVATCIIGKVACNIHIPEEYDIFFYIKLCTRKIVIHINPGGSGRSTSRALGSCGANAKCINLRIRY